MKKPTLTCDIFIPIRLTNTRLPGKALKTINQKPIILYLLDRLKTCKKIRNIVVCTTNNSTDDPLVEKLHDYDIEIFRGSEKDILIRFLGAAKQFEPDLIINVDGDDIYSDPELVDYVVDEFHRTNADYIDMFDFPFGFRMVGFSKSSLEQVCELKNTNDTETGYRDFFYKLPSLKIHKIHFKDNKTFPPELRLSLDYQEDLDFAKLIFKKLGNNFHLKDILLEIKNDPNLLKYTNGLEEKWKKHYEDNLTSFSIKKNSGD